MTNGHAETTQDVEDNTEVEHNEIDRKFQGKESFLSSQISLYVQETKPNIPDGGWGAGVTLAFGFLYIEFVNEFKASASATSWIGSLFMAVPLIAGPFASALVDKYGCRSMTIAGGVITAVAFIASAYARSIGVMYITFGVLGGIGRGLTYVTCVVCIAFWFEKRRSVALGLAASGAGFGTVFFPPLTTALIDIYLWRGTLIITAGIFGNMCVCGMLMRDPDWMLEDEERRKATKRADKAKLQTLPEEEMAGDVKNQEEGQELLKNDSPHKNNGKGRRHSSMVNLSTYSKRRVSTLYRMFLFEVPAEQIGNKNLLNFKDKSRRGYLNHLRIRKNSIGHKGVILGVHKLETRALSCPNIYRHATLSIDKKEEKWYDEFLNILKSLTNVSLYLELHFLMLSTSTIILFIWFIVPYFYLAEHMERIGYTRDQSSFIISVIGFTNTIGMVGLGWIGDRLNVTKTYAVCLILCGFSVLSMICFSLSPSVLAQLVPLEGFTMAFGLGLLNEGIGNLLGPPLAGLIFDLTQSWKLSFYTAGFSIIASGLLIGSIPYTRNRRIFGSGPLLKTQNREHESTNFV
ncbi:hypothetical protein NQ317_010928 [Molorchus minor]|uniref:Major facilitator superfamily (MFS) profile domain-containing protein n=1 Tax=Molorchus minor TaxID=1323400 RepID=A0ABQ9J2Q0_9CUCU|nr:hypothetical protein NQ317_010928 [Molorchus minor]